MSDSESIKKMLRSVLQSSKDGVSVTRLQSDYQALCGEVIPLKKLGFVKLDDYLRSIPSVVRLEYRMGDLKCFAAVCKETAHIAELVAKQKSSKKSGCSRVVNCRMRFKPSNPCMLNVNQRSLRQPLASRTVIGSANRSRSRGGCSASGDYRQLDHRLSSITPVEHRQPAPQTAVKQSFTTHRKEQGSSKAQKRHGKATEQTSTANQSQPSVYDVELVQSRLTQLLEKYSNGLWMSKLADIYSKMFGQKLHPQVLKDLEKWTHICMVEQPSSNNRVNYVIYPPLPLRCSVIPRRSPSESSPKLSSNSTVTTPISSPPSIPKQISSHLPAYPEPKHRVSPKSPLAKATFIFSQQPVAVSSDNPLSSATLRSPGHNPAPQLPPCVSLEVNAIGGCEAKKATGCPTSFRQPGPDNLPTLNSASAPSPKPSNNLPTEVFQRIKDLLSKYSQGIWAHALPKLFMDTYKTPFPEHILDNLSNYLHIWNVEYPISHNKKKAILYNASRTDTDTTDCEESQECRSHPLPSGLQVLSDVVPPCLVPPSEQFPSVLVTDVISSNAVTIRYVGKNYSYAQEAMEDSMRSFYSQSISCHPLRNPVVGQLAAIRAEDGDELARGQVMEIMSPEKIKVYYVDHGFSVEISGLNLLELHQDFLSLPFQAANVRLAGLEAFSFHPLVVSSLRHLAVDKILLMQRLEPCQQNETPLVVLYDTSQDDDVNINSACLKALQDNTMDNPLSVNATYEVVSVTNVCENGNIYCQLPSRGTARLSKLLQQTEAFLNAQVSSEPLVSRPFIGKICLARYKGQWSRVEVTNIYGTRVMEISFIDIGVSATVEVTDLREIPSICLQYSAIIPPQAVKCCLADLPIPDDDHWSPKVVQWLKETVLGSGDCKMKVVKLVEHNGERLVHMYLFVGVDNQELDKSINRQLANSWHLFPTQKNSATLNNNINEETGLCALVQKLTLDNSASGSIGQPSGQPHQGSGDLSLQHTAPIGPTLPLPMPPPLVLPQAGQNMDVFVSVACHPGYFVLQPWQELHKLEVLTGEMILYYNQTEKTQSAVDIQKGEVYAAKIDKNWHRVQVKGILTNGWVSVYELDHGRHELVRSTFLTPLLEEFRQLPFQAVTAQLAGMTQNHWSEEACMLFRNHVERRALVAQVERVQELSEVKGGSWERKLTVYLVDTTVDERDLWIHNIMADISSNLSSAA